VRDLVTLGDESVYLYVALLTDPESAVGRLRFHGRISPEIVVDHVGRGGEV
jgi:hypothetical protein